MQAKQASGNQVHELASLLVNAPKNHPHKLHDALIDTSLVPTLDYHGITLLVAKQNKELQQFEPLAQLFKQRRALMISNEALIRNALRDTFDDFVASGLTRFIVFKGTALAYSLYPQPWLRPRTDCDLLIDVDDLEKFTQVFSRLGFKSLFGISGDYVSYQRTFSLSLAGNSNLNIDLHWRINNRQCLANSFSVDELLLNSHNISALSPHANIPSAIDSLLIAGLHRLGHHANEERIAWLYDIHLLAETLSPKHWAILLEKSKNKQLCNVMLDALLCCQDALLTPIPDQNIESLRTLSKSNEASKFLLERERPEWQYFIHDLKCLDWRAKLSFIKETLFPPADYVRQQMNTQSALVGYLKRFARGIVRVSRDSS